jgi:dTDP-4-amino-4,6-dideoxygalactose transaminase
VDVEDETFNIDVEKIEDKVTKKTRAIMPVHLYGHSAEMDAIMDIAEDRGLAVIEDACQSHGAAFNGKQVGSFGAGCFSFYPTKNMTTSEGGIITTDDKALAERAEMIRAHGSKQRYVHEMLGFNLRMTDIAAAIGLCQLKKLPGFNAKRIHNAEDLSAGIKNSRIIAPTVREGCRHVFHQYTIRVKKERDAVLDLLTKKGIGTGVYYPTPIHQQKLYKDLGYKERFQVSERLAGEVISLPVHPSVTEDDLDYIISVLNGL